MLSFFTENVVVLVGLFFALSFFNYIECRRLVGWCLAIMFVVIGWDVYKQGTFSLALIPTVILTLCGYLVIGSGWAVWCYRQICEQLLAKMQDDLRYADIRPERRTELTNSVKRTMSVRYNADTLSYSMIFWPVDVCSSLFGGVFRLADNIIQGIRAVTYDKIRVHYESKVDAIADQAFNPVKER